MNSEVVICGYHRLNLWNSILGPGTYAADACLSAIRQYSVTIDNFRYKLQISSMIIELRIFLSSDLATRAWKVN